MRVLRGSWRGWDLGPEKSSVTIGVLDGVHRGHQALIAGLDSDLVRTVLTFDPHPIEVLHPGTNPRLITTIEERVGLLEPWGIDQVGILDLTEIKDLGPEEFVDEVLVRTLRVGDLVAGPDFRFGKERAGDVKLLQTLGKSREFAIRVLDLVHDHEGVVSSSRIREMIESGCMREAEEALGYGYQLSSTVVRGDNRGREIGFPTANLLPPGRKVIPAIGVYAAFARVGGEVHEAAVSVGVRPTFGGGDLLIEAHILEFSDEIYDEVLTVEFVDFLRPELTFNGVDDLITAMRSDVENTRRRLASAATNMS
ncbi:MAG: bifunctional riboflavin kinase/FAD synthetase [Acidobacteria bacterium]|nr:MAG: bifunctional riboflavin kinase/FAD synthetase [Acidobacteriota bacterium]